LSPFNVTLYFSFFKDFSKNQFQISNSKFKNKKDKKSGRPKIDKKDIGEPTDFKHVGHIGFTPDTGYEVDIFLFILITNS